MRKGYKRCGDVMEDTRFLIGQGCAEAEIMAKLGYRSRNSFYMALYRAGAPRVTRRGGEQRNERVTLQERFRKVSP